MSSERRLADELAETTRAYRTRLSIDLALLGALLEIGETGSAVGMLEDERRALQNLAAGLQEALAVATEDREA